MGVSFWPKDQQSCIPITIIEVPCDIRSPDNSCLWDGKGEGNQCCSPNGCTGQEAVRHEWGEIYGGIGGHSGVVNTHAT